MANSFFRFKQFTIHQEDCAQKVGTLSCIFGAVIDAENPKRILDIGTGTGLLSLMCAQKFEWAQIDALEIEEKCFAQALKNFGASPWGERINGICADVRQYAKASGAKYDLIISNPPFFEGYLKSTCEAINLARHNTSLSFEELAISAHSLLDEGGKMYFLLPQYEMGQLKKELAKYQYFCCSGLNIKNFPGLDIKAQICGFSSCAQQIKESELVIRQDDGQYTEVFKSIMSPFYFKEL